MASPNLVLHLVSSIRQSLSLCFADIHMFRKCRHFLSRCAQDEQISDSLSNISASFNYKQKYRILKYTSDNHITSSNTLYVLQKLISTKDSSSRNCSSGKSGAARSSCFHMGVLFI